MIIFYGIGALIAFIGVIALWVRTLKMATHYEREYDDAYNRSKQRGKQLASEMGLSNFVSRKIDLIHTLHTNNDLSSLDMEIIIEEIKTEYDRVRGEA